MDWLTLLVGFALGLLGTLIAFGFERWWRIKDDLRRSMNIVKSLVVEIEEAIKRAKYMIELLDTGQISYSHLYIERWQSSYQNLAATLSDTRIWELLFRIYYRFDLINFNCENNRPGSGGAFAKDYIPEVEINLNELKKLIGIPKDNC